MITLFTIGFTRKNAETFFGLLKQARIRHLIAVRLNNLSQLAGFSKRDDLAYFTRSLTRADYLHLPELAPTQTLLQRYRKDTRDWEEYARGFRALLARRKIEDRLSPAALDGACLLCSEENPEHCHRRLVAEHLRKKWGKVEIIHLGSGAGSRPEG